MKKSLRSFIGFTDSRNLLTLIILGSLFIGPLGPAAHAENYSCLNRPQLVTDVPYWTTSESKDLTFTVSWTFIDPEACLLPNQAEKFGSDFKFKTFVDPLRDWTFPTTWDLIRSGEQVLVSATFTFPVGLLQALPNTGTSSGLIDFFEGAEGLSVLAQLPYKTSDSRSSLFIRTAMGLRQLWGYWFSKNQGIFPTECKPPQLNLGQDFAQSNKNHLITWKVLETGLSPKIEISLNNTSNCILVVHAGPLTKSASNSIGSFLTIQSLAEYPFWEKEGSEYFKEILSKPDQIIQVGLGNFVGNEGEIFYESRLGNLSVTTVNVEKLPDQKLVHQDSISKTGTTIKLVTTLDMKDVAPSDSRDVILYVGFYSWYIKNSVSSPSGWRITSRGGSYTATYSKGFYQEPGKFLQYFTRAIRIPASNIRISAEARATTELRAKQEAEAKAAAELKAQQDTEAKAAAELKAKIQAQFEELEAKNAAAKATATKKTTITCAKGKLIKRVTAIKPKCPAGYKVKK